MPNEIGRRCSASSNACCQRTRAPRLSQRHKLGAPARGKSLDLLGVGLDVRVTFLVQLPEPARDEREHRDLETRRHA